ncbi:hypothetical protein ACVWY2_006786 [Bradyrhizobium sp. JR6.1]
MQRARLAPYEQESDYGRPGEASDDERMAPAEHAALYQGAGQPTECCDRRDLPRQINLALREPRRLLGVTPGEPEARGANRQVDKKDRAPADQRDQRAAN